MMPHKCMVCGLLEKEHTGEERHLFTEWYEVDRQAEFTITPYVLGACLGLSVLVWIVIAIIFWMAVLP